VVRNGAGSRYGTYGYPGMWVIDLWRFNDDGPEHEGTSLAEDKEAALEQAHALDLDDSMGATVYRQASGAGFPTPEPGQVVVQDD
jgi:hypothetical protein